MADVTMKKAVTYTAISKYSSVVLNLIFTAILSRILTPKEFGTVAVINVFVVFFKLFADMGFGTAVIQDKSLTKRETSDVFSWMVYLGVLLQFLFVGASFPISIFYSDSIYIPLGIILSFSLCMNAMNMIPNAVMLKEKRFASITKRTITTCLLTYAITILLALKGLGVFALVIQHVLESLFLLIWNCYSTKLVFRFKPKFEIIQRLWGYSVYQFFALFLNYFNRNLDNLLIGKFFSKADLGYYNKSYHLMQMPIIYIPGVIGPALHPILSEHSDNPSYIFDKYKKILKLLSLIGCFLSVILFYLSEEVIMLLFGNQWEAAVQPFKILALSVWFQMSTNTIAPIYQSLGNTKLLFKSVLTSSVIIVASIIIGILFGNIVSVATAVSIGYIINYFTTFYILVHIGMRMNFWSFLADFKIEALIFVVLLFIAFFTRISITNLIISFLVKSAVITCAYIILIYFFKQQEVIMSIFRKKKS